MITVSKINSQSWNKSDISVLPVFPQWELLKLDCKVFLLKLKDFEDKNNGIDAELIQDFYDIAFVIDDCIHQKKMQDGEK